MVGFERGVGNGGIIRDGLSIQFEGEQVERLYEEIGGPMEGMVPFDYSVGRMFVGYPDTPCDRPEDGVICLLYGHRSHFGIVTVEEPNVIIHNDFRSYAFGSSKLRNLVVSGERNIRLDIGPQCTNLESLRYVCGQLSRISLENLSAFRELVIEKTSRSKDTVLAVEGMSLTLKGEVPDNLALRDVDLNIEIEGSFSIDRLLIMGDSRIQVNGGSLDVGSLVTCGAVDTSFCTFREFNILHSRSAEHSPFSLVLCWMKSAYTWRLFCSESR